MKTKEKKVNMKINKEKIYIEIESEEFNTDIEDCMRTTSIDIKDCTSSVSLDYKDCESKMIKKADCKEGEKEGNLIKDQVNNVVIIASGRIVKPPNRFYLYLLITYFTLLLKAILNNIMKYICNNIILTISAIYYYCM